VKKQLGNRRVTGKEQYYTPRALARELVAVVAEVIPDFGSRSFLEPAGGNGSFISSLEDKGIKKILAVDLYPKHDRVQSGDFLDFKSAENDLVTISNPPFGRNNALAIPFFNHAANFSEYICFLVPRSWRKWSVQNRLDERFHQLLDEEVFVSYEDEAGVPVRQANNLRTCFQIWQRKQTLREKVVVPDNGLIQKVSPEQAQLAIRVFGYGCGKVLTEFEPKKNTTLMFLRAKNQQVTRLLPKLDYQRFSKNTAYTEALAFTEINFLLNEELFGSGFHHEKGI
jgi:predicted RNA methylase